MGKIFKLNYGGFSSSLNTSKVLAIFVFAFPVLAIGSMRLLGGSPEQYEQFPALKKQFLKLFRWFSYLLTILGICVIFNALPNFFVLKKSRKYLKI